MIGWSPAEIVLGWIAITSGGLFAACFAAFIASEVLKPEVRHPYRDDLPEWWG